MVANKAFPSNAPPAYSPYHEVGAGTSKSASPSMWNPLHWPKWTWLASVFVVAAIVVGVSVGVVEEEKNRYPDYDYLEYFLVDTISGTDFFDSFDYYTGTDPSDGFVTYVDSTVADSSQYNLTYATSTSAVLKVDTTSNDATAGRYSVRLESKKQYDTGLFVFDIVHTPYGCGTWPALWLTDPSNWPTNGEIDVLEAVNQATTGNQMTLHTTKDCTMNVKRKETGTPLYDTCLWSANSESGCGVKGGDASYGEAFNSNGGGIYAMELRDAGIRVWFFDRSSIPSDLDSGDDSSPNPENWGEALADFPSTDCDIATHFTNQSIIANIDFCGGWAGDTTIYSTEDQCPDTCEEYVTTNGTAFEEAYWEFNSFRIYQA